LPAYRPSPATKNKQHAPTPTNTKVRNGKQAGRFLVVAFENFKLCAPLFPLNLSRFKFKVLVMLVAGLALCHGEGSDLTSKPGTDMRTFRRRTNKADQLS
jgi:hypothetical protein